MFIGPGSRIFGDITIADGIVVAANSVITKSFLEPNITIAGAPARKISDNGTESVWRPGERDALISYVEAHKSQFAE